MCKKYHGLAIGLPVLVDLNHYVHHPLFSLAGWISLGSCFCYAPSDLLIHHSNKTKKSGFAPQIRLRLSICFIFIKFV
jgi:hypothetical protein